MTACLLRRAARACQLASDAYQTAADVLWLAAYMACPIPEEDHRG